MMYLPDYRAYAADYAGEFVAGFDIDKMAEMLRDACDGSSPDGMDPDDFDEIVRACEL